MGDQRASLGRVGAVVATATATATAALDRSWPISPRWFR